MSWRGGIIGLPNAGKTTIFNALTAGQAEVAPYPFCTISPNTGVAPVPDPRLARLGQLLKPEKLTPASIEFVDVAGLIEGASRGEGLGNQFLGHIREVDLLVHVVRCFGDESCPHPLAVLDPARDVEVVETELLLADLEILGRLSASSAEYPFDLLGSKRVNCIADSIVIVDVPPLETAAP